MTPDPEELGRLLSLALLIGATIEYAEIVRRRAALRLEAADRELFGREGLRALVRVIAAN